MPSTPGPAEGRVEPLLRVRELCVGYRARSGADAAAPALRVLKGVSFDMGRGECLGVVGESGSGKSQLLLALLGLSAQGAEVSGSVRWRGEELRGASASRLATLRGRHIAMVFQDSFSALNPYLRIGAQLCEGARRQLGLTRQAARRRAVELLERVQIDASARRLEQYPHELSGGMRQRVMIAMALMCEPQLLLLDEPTTALDTTVQWQVLALLRELRERSGISCVFVTHDLAVLAGIAQRVAVMYAGRIIELALASTLYATPAHPYTAGLLRSLPRLDAPLRERLPAIPGQPPTAADCPSGCAFAPRCTLADERCRLEPALRARASADSWVACHVEELARIQQAWQ